MIMLNPVTCAVEAFRWVFLGAGTVSVLNWSVSTLVTAIVVVLGVVIFSKVEKTFMDTV